MLTKNEISNLNLSTTKKDFVQIWNELLEVAGKLSERWDPTSTNESDPGIVILKALTGIADKLNYNIDKNTLEAFMPTAAQEDSMRKLCDMLGYNIKYYRSATTSVTVRYHNSAPDDDENAAMQANSGLGQPIPRFTVISNSDGDINYFTTNKSAVYISSSDPIKKLECMEGQIVKCESINDNNVITVNQISENNRFYLPETQIAENGIFIYNVVYSSNENSYEDTEAWEKVDNLNTQARASKVYKFGFDSYESRPYIEFPEDYSELFGDGIFIYYTRTSGVNGNISARTLSQIELPTTGGWSDVAASSISVENALAATEGANIETIGQAYNNFKKTIGTFETLVTCRDYMNKIYSIVDDYTNKPLVSNILVTDIRNDLNRAVTICSCDDSGIFYKETPIYRDIEEDFEVEIEEKTISHTSDAYKPVFKDSSWYIGDLKITNKANLIPNNNSEFSLGTDGEVGIENDYYVIKQGENTFITCLKPLKEDVEVEGEVRTETIKTKEPAINHFDLVFYPFKSYNQIKNNYNSNIDDIRKPYDESFVYSSDKFGQIKTELEARNLKTIAHNIIQPRDGDIVSINNYYRIDATIATNSKITTAEADLLKDTIKIALANAFNMRELDFGEEIPFESIVEVIENADPIIKVASLNEPTLYTTFSIYEKESPRSNKLVVKEYAVASKFLDDTMAESTERFVEDDKLLERFNVEKAKEKYNYLAVRNVLAGRVPLFNYYNTFSSNFNESPYQVTSKVLVSDISSIFKIVDGNLVISGDLTIEEDGTSTKISSNNLMPNAEVPFKVYKVGDRTYTSQRLGLNGDDIPASVKTALDDPNNPNKISGTNLIYTTYEDVYYFKNTTEGILQPYHKVIFTVTKTPEGLVTIQPAGSAEAKKDKIENNIVKYVEDNNITNIETECKILSDTYNPSQISDVKLNSGEFIKFRAPNFYTVKTYPAYVNYHLILNKELFSDARQAKATSLFELLNSDWAEAEKAGSTIKWEKVLQYFKAKDEGITSESDKFVKTFKIKQKVSGYSKDSPEHSTIIDGPIKIEVDNPGKDLKTETSESLLAKSGCVKLISKDAKLLYVSEEGEPIDGVSGPSLNISLDINNQYIVDSSVLASIQSAVDTRIEELRQQTDGNGNPMLPEDDWQISFEFECVPLSPVSYGAWKTFIETEYSDLFDFAPIKENDTLFWRVYGEGNPAGKYILKSTEKLLEFNSKYFDSLPDTYMRGIYLVEDLGQDEVPSSIENGEEYQLRAGEYLYIEYTPSSTTEEGTVEELSTKHEILVPGSIIKPSGFENGLQDSSILAQSSTPFKTVTFKDENGLTTTLGMQRLGASEQIEVRDFAKVTLDKTSFNNSAMIYIYKNFNDCEALEKAGSGSRTYILQDGEYIYYTDIHQAEFAYYGAGTQVTLTGDLVLNKFNKVELSEVLNTGLHIVPWQTIHFTDNKDSISFQEYQYITLGPDDKLTSLRLMDGSSQLDSTWRECSDVKYFLAGQNEAEESPNSLPAVNIKEGTEGCGWEASVALELSVSPDSAQLLRNTTAELNGRLQTSITLVSKSPAGNDINKMIISPEQGEDAIAFKTNLACQTGSNKFSLDDIISKPKEVKGFEFKVFKQDEPVIVKTQQGTLLPFMKNEDSTAVDIAEWHGIPISSRDLSEIWYTVELQDIQVKIKNSDSDENSDSALRLPILTLPDTYGVFSIYIKYAESADGLEPSTWIEVPAGTEQKDITLLHLDSSENEARWETDDEHPYNPNKLYLNEGINCIRVNTSGRIFIKTSENSNGTLYFDDLRLVNYEKIEYVSAEGAFDYTQGLNIEQLGYLSTTESKVTTADYQSKRIDGLINSTFDEVDNIYKENDKTISDKYNELAKYKDQVDEFVKLETAINSDIVRLTSNADLATLKDIYTSVSTALNNEEALLTALKDERESVSSSGKLLEILNGLTPIETRQQQLKDRLAEIVSEIKASLDSFSTEDMLTDFRAAYNQANKLPDEVKALVYKKIDESYTAELAKLATEADRIVNSEDRETILKVIADCQTTLYTDKHSKLAVLIGQLKNEVEHDSLDDVLYSMTEAASTADYSQLLVDIARLKDMLIYKDLRYLSIQLEQAISDKDYAYIEELIISYLSGGTTTTWPVDYIDNLRDSVQSEVTKPTTDSGEEVSVNEAILSDVEDLSNKIRSNFESAQSLVLEEIATIIEDLNSKSTSLDRAKKLIEEAKDSEVGSFITKLDEVIKKYFDYTITVSGEERLILGYRNYFEEYCNKSSYNYIWPDADKDRPGLGDEYIAWIEEAVLEYQPEALRIAVDSELVTLANEYESAIINLTGITELPTDLIVAGNRLNSHISTYESSLEDLKNQINNLSNAKVQNNSRIGYLSTLSGISIGKFSNKVSNIFDSDSSEKVISELISKLTASSLTILEKKQILNNLQVEVEKLKESDAELVSILESMLFPSIVAFEVDKEKASDNFYDKLFMRITLSDEEKKQLRTPAQKLKERLVNNWSALIISYDEAYKGALSGLSNFISYISDCDGNETPVDWLPNCLKITEKATKAEKEKDFSDIKGAASLYNDTILINQYKFDITKLINDILIINDNWNKDINILGLIDSSSIEGKALKAAMERVKDEENNVLFTKLAESIKTVMEETAIGESFKNQYLTLKLEEALLQEIRRIDINHDFYYTAPVEASLAIDFNESNKDYNTLMNPVFNFDINNVNNSFVIPKLDIKYLNDGIRIARSSRIN
jgi:hypothetical protein